MVNGNSITKFTVHLSPVTMYGNLFATEKFPTKTLLEMIDSSVRNLGEVEYDN